MQKQIDLGEGFVLIVGQGEGALSSSWVGRLYTHSGERLSALRNYLRSTMAELEVAALKDLNDQRFGPYRGKGEKTSSDN